MVHGLLQATFRELILDGPICVNIVRSCLDYRYVSSQSTINH